MKTNTLVDSVLKAAAGLKPATGTATQASTAAVAPLITLLPKILPFVARSARRHPTQAVIAGVGLLLLAVAKGRRSQRRYSPNFD